jgi:hypothetical protein
MIGGVNMHAARVPDLLPVLVTREIEKLERMLDASVIIMLYAAE